MKKEILKIGLALSAKEQKQIEGGCGLGCLDGTCFTIPINLCWSNACQVYECPDGSEYCGPASPHASNC